MKKAPVKKVAARKAAAKKAPAARPPKTAREHFLHRVAGETPIGSTVTMPPGFTKKKSADAGPSTDAATEK